MITPNQTFSCVCQKCKGEWMTQSNKLPAVCRHCKTAKWNDDYTPPEPKPKPTILDHVKALTTAQRMTLFESFELCCAMNRGACVCPPEVIETKPIQTPVIAPSGMNDAMARFMAKLGTQPVIEREPDQWIFSSSKVDFADNGNAYRDQYLASNPKKHRTVRVDYDINDRIIEQ